MSRKKLAADGEDGSDRFMRLMPKSQDLSLVILKGHLLIEENLFGYVCAWCNNPSALSKARLTFAQKIGLAEAFMGTASSSRMKLFLKRINKIRNDISHVAELPNLEKDVDELIAPYLEDGATASLGKRSRANHLRAAIAFVCGGLEGMTSMVVANRSERNATRS